MVSFTVPRASELPGSPADGLAIAPETTLRKAEWQPDLFAVRPLRLKLLTLSPSWPCAEIRIRVHRNHAFEHVAHARPYLAYAGWRGEFLYGDYDDSLSFAGVHSGQTADAEIVWLDFTRYEMRSDPPSLASWLSGRLRDLRRERGTDTSGGLGGRRLGCGGFSRRARLRRSARCQACICVTPDR